MRSTLAHHVRDVAVVLPHLREETGVFDLVRQRPFSNRAVRRATHDTAAGEVDGGGVGGGIAAVDTMLVDWMDSNSNCC